MHGPLLLVMLIMVLGFVRVLTAHWREGSVLLGGALLVAATLRILLPDDRIGLLAIRSRVIDVWCYTGFGLVMIALAVTITRATLTAP
nr:DUF3017 domain-containing protein [Pseudonocardia asaccharolytica]